MLVNNLSDGTCETKDIIIESELLMQKLAELLVSSNVNNESLFIPFLSSNTLKQAFSYLSHVYKLSNISPEETAMVSSTNSTSICGA